jgi:hypothetical protein
MRVQKMQYKALLLSILPLYLTLASENCNWHDVEMHDTLNIYLASSIVGSLVQGVEYNEKSKTIVDMTMMWINADLSGAEGKGNRIEVRETRTFNDSGRLSSAYQELIGQSGTNSWSLSKDANEWNLSAVIGGQKTKKRILSVPDNLLADCRMRQEIKNGSMKSGRQWRDTVFEMMSGQPIATTTLCTSVDSLHRQWTFTLIDDLSNRTEKCVLNVEGKTIERSIEGIYTAKHRTTNKDANGNGPVVTNKTNKGSITELFTVPADGACPQGKSIAVVFSDSSLSLDSSVRFIYKKRNSTWILQEIPSKCPQKGAITFDSAIKKWLHPGMAIQSDHPNIVELSRKLRDKETDPCAIVARFNHYVFSHLQKRNTAAFSNALETLNAGYGDCGEHAALLTALLRAAGVPARVALGLLYVESKQQYLYHAQVMAFTGQWVFADPTWDIFPASGRFVPLIIDDSSGASAMLLSRLLGKFKIDYVNYF